jgi:hypothetical protein
MSNPEILNVDIRPTFYGFENKKIAKTIAQDAGGVIPAVSALGEVVVNTDPDSVTVSAITGTGNGTCVKDATTPVLAGAIPGNYRIECVGDGADHNSEWEVTDPLGNIVGTFAINATGGSFTFENQIKFVLTDGSTDFTTGAFFIFPVAAGSGKLKRSVSTATDGSEIPKYLAFNAINAVGGDVTRDVYLRGLVRKEAIVFTGSETLATVVRGKTMQQWLELSNIFPDDGQNFGALDNQ